MAATSIDVQKTGIMRSNFGAVAVCVLVLAMLVPPPTLGHHSFFGRFDTRTFIEIEGEVTQVAWRNPHAYVIVESTEQNGERVRWELETSSAATLVRSGIERESINVGDRVRVAGYPPTGNDREMFATNLLGPSGVELLLRRNIEARWTDETTGDDSYFFQTEGDSSRPELGIYRVWSHTSTIPFLFPEINDLSYSVNRYPMTDAARAVLADFDRTTDNPTANCTPKGMPTIMEQPYPMEIAQDGNNILLRIEEYDLIRTIHMDEDGVPVGEARSPLGYSRGQWDGTTLDVTTTHLSWPWFNQLGIPQSPDSVLVERFSPTEDGSRLDYDLTVTDPINFTEPVTLEHYWLYRPEEVILPYDCTETIP